MQTKNGLVSRKGLFRICFDGKSDELKNIDKDSIDKPFKLGLNTPLLNSVINKNREVFFTLIDLDCSLFSINNRGLTPLEALGWRNGFWWIEDNLELID